nr:hypothetical protein CFP56_44444 [Quercus suber]
MTKTPSPATAAPRGALPPSISSSIITRIFASPMKRSPKSPSTPSRSRAKLTKRAPSARNKQSSPSPRMPRRKDSLAVTETAFFSKASPAASMPASPSSSFYSTSPTSSIASLPPSSLDRDSLASLVQNLARYPPRPHTPRRSSTWHTLPPLHDSAPSSLRTPSVLDLAGESWDSSTYICAIHSVSSTDHRTTQIQLTQRVVDVGGEILDSFAPGGFINPLVDAEMTVLGGHIDVLVNPTTKSNGQGGHDGSLESVEGRKLDGPLNDAHDEWCDGDGGEVELWGGKPAKKSHGWLARRPFGSRKSAKRIKSCEM